MGVNSFTMPTETRSLAEIPASELHRHLEQMFKDGDTNGDGVLDTVELRDLLRKSGFNFDDATIQRLIVAADTNKDGVIQFDEFSQVMNYLIRELPRSEMRSLNNVSTPELRSYLERLFKIGDTNNDGVLSPQEFHRLLRKSGFHFSNSTIIKLMNIVDTNRDGVIEYKEFVPAILALLRKIAPESHSSTLNQEGKNTMPTPSEVPIAQLDKYMDKLFKLGDLNGDGHLDAMEMRTLMRTCGFQINNQTIARIMVDADTNRDGIIQYDEFCRCIRKLHTEGFPTVHHGLPDVSKATPAELKSYLERLFKIADANGDGVLQPYEFEALLRKSGFNFDNLTIRQFMEAADTNHDGVIQYEEFVPAMMSILGAKHDADCEAPEHVGTKEEMPDFHTVRPEQLELYFQRLFKIGDRDGNGVLDSLEIRDVLRKSKFMFDNETISRILVAADTNRDGVIQYSEFLPAMRALFQKINPVQGQKHVHNAHTREAITAEYEAGIPSHPSVVAKMQRHAPAPVQGHHFLDAQGAWDPHFGSHHLEAPDPTYWQEHNLQKKGIETILNHHHKQQYGVNVPGARLGNPSHQVCVVCYPKSPLSSHPSSHVLSLHLHLHLHLLLRVNQNHKQKTSQSFLLDSIQVCTASILAHFPLLLFLETCPSWVWVDSLDNMNSVILVWVDSTEHMEPMEHMEHQACMECTGHHAHGNRSLSYLSKHYIADS